MPMKFRRALAWFIDFALVVAGASALAVLTFHRVSALVTDVPALAALGGLQLLTSPDAFTDASAEVGLVLWNKSVLYVEQAFVLLILGTFLYQWAAMAFTGSTIGKALLGLKVAPVAPVAPVTPRRVVLRAAVTTTADVAVYALACVLLFEGQFVLSTLVWATAVLVFVGNALPVLSPSSRSLADRLAGTAVTGMGFGRGNRG